MTTKPNEPDALEPMPCPFCAASFRHVSDKDGEFWMHPGVVTDDDCFMSGQGIFPRQLSAWNRRAHANPIADAGGVTDADREAAAKCAEHGLSRPNPLNVRQGVVDSWHLVQAFAAHRLQSVAAATAAKDAAIRARDDHFRNAQRLAEKLVAKVAEIARLREALEKIQPVACGDWCRDDKHIPECENARAALSEAREAGDSLAAGDRV